MRSYRGDYFCLAYELRHYGIEGQKWGIRRGPPYPIEDKTLRAGTRLNSVSYIPNDKSGSEVYRKRNVPMYSYRDDDDYDKSVYKGAFTYGKVMSTHRFVYEHQYEVVKDLKMPTSKERIDEFINQYKNDKATVAKDLGKYRKMVLKNMPNNNWSDEEKKINLKKLKTDEDYKAAYKVFSRAMELSYSFKSTKRYLDAMSQKYDAMVDDNNVGIYNGAHDPIIIFKANESLRDVGNLPMPKKIEVDEMLNHLSVVSKEVAKSGKKVAL